MSLKKKLARGFDHLILIVGVVLLVGPLAYLFWMSLGDAGDPFAGYSALATRRFGFSEMISVWSMLKTSLLVALAFGVFKTLLAMMAAYGLVFFRVRFGAFWFFCILLTMYLPIHARPVQTYLVSAGLGLVNTPAGLVVPLLASGLGVLLFRQFFRQFPGELLEAARIDGAGPMKFFIDCVVPVSVPFIAALFAIHFIEGWKQYLWPGLVISDERYTVLMRGLALVFSGSPIGLALAIVALLPPLILVVLLGPFIARSMHLDAVDR